MLLVNSQIITVHANAVIDENHILGAIHARSLWRLWRKVNIFFLWFDSHHRFNKTHCHLRVTLFSQNLRVSDSCVCHHWQEASLLPLLAFNPDRQNDDIKTIHDSLLLGCSQILTMTEPFTSGFTHEIINTWWWYWWWWQQISSKFQCEVEYTGKAKSSLLRKNMNFLNRLRKTVRVQMLFGFRKQNLSPAVITGSTALSPAKQSPELPAWVQTAPACRTSGNVSRSGQQGGSYCPLYSAYGWLENPNKHYKT